MPDEKKPEIRLAPTDKVEEYEAEVRRILAAIGHPEALVTDWSRFIHFMNWLDPEEEAEDQAKLHEALAKLSLDGMVSADNYIWEAARLLRMKREPQ